MPGLAGQILDCRGMKIVTGRAPSVPNWPRVTRPSLQFCLTFRTGHAAPGAGRLQGKSQTFKPVRSSLRHGGRHHHRCEKRCRSASSGDHAADDRCAGLPLDGQVRFPLCPHPAEALGVVLAAALGQVAGHLSQSFGSALYEAGPAQSFQPTDMALTDDLLQAAARHSLPVCHGGSSGTRRSSRRPGI